MGFWIFMLVCNLLIPLTMIGFGSYFVNRAPKEINMIFGYRTSMSMKNKDTWIFAHHYCGKLWRLMGWILLGISIIAMLFVIGKEIDTVGIFSLIVIVLQSVIFLIVSIFPTEIALKKNFDKNGERKTNYNKMEK